ncbi:UDP-N-acetylmuramoyl-L-alanine--D-glutamate ligase [Oscillibacter hominis]|uniref:UDP-N-acetylmuramoylalanine--D-glutamate ligase n=1 Tax=Oscillibacter hominis TaxID=2763056 RepID=A0A7G9B7P0_9FIRM|nr:UDP-N-acetylmuramoyl-L-alanine--D-glutamate ligase [Oscillibacter hominis]QNL45571.1 UDP-N-acetylmuramoyl-L-alanine--D-glutamate ligase [Oscillibacter hominis]
MNLQEYLHSIQDKTVAVIGIGVSNTPLLELLAKSGISVTACDKKDREALGETADRLESMGVQLKLGPRYLRGLRQDIIFRTPGLRPDVPELLEARERGSVITSEMEVFFEVCPCPILAVSGSDGKTTTTTVISEFLKKEGKRVYVGGNIGHPLLAEADQMRPDDVAVLELSSFQLMTMKRSPHVAVLTNLAPNHLDVHKDMAEYVAAKENLFLHQSDDDLAVFNRDNKITYELSKEARGRVRLFSRTCELEEGVFLRDDAIICRSGGVEREVLKTEDIFLPGVHNIENYMAAIAAVDGLVSDETIREVARTFQGVEHRIELVRTLRGVRYYNDSIASSPSRTIAGLRSFPEKVILIAGGYDKHIPFGVLGPEIVEHVKLLILCGATADQIRAAVVGAPNYRQGCPEMVEVHTLQEAVETASNRAVSGDVVTLSPACAAFDQFPNFMVRGTVFKSIVNDLK